VIHAPGPAPGVYAAKLRFQPSRDFRNRPPACASHTRAHPYTYTRFAFVTRVPFSSLFRRVAPSPRQCVPGTIPRRLRCPPFTRDSRSRSSRSWQLTRSINRSSLLEYFSLADSSNPRVRRSFALALNSPLRDSRSRLSIVRSSILLVRHRAPFLANGRPVHVRGSPSRVINSGRRSKAIPWGRELSPRF